MGRDNCTGRLVDNRNVPIEEIIDRIDNGGYKYTDEYKESWVFTLVDSINGYYRKLIYRKTTGGLWVLQN